MSRHRILARVRAALDGSPPVPAPPRHGAPRSLASTGRAAVARFRVAAGSKGVVVIDLPVLDALPGAVAAIMAAETGAARSNVRMSEPGFQGLDWTGAGIAIAPGAAESGDAAALSRGLAGIAESGSVLLASGPENPTTLAFLPETHLVVLDAAAVVGTFEDANAVLRAIYGDHSPRAINIVSGASRTGDIGGRIVHGAHGPRRLVVFIVADNTDQGAAGAP